MRKKNYKGRCMKMHMSKSKETVRVYDDLQSAYANILQNDASIQEFQCNVRLDDTEYMTDFLCVQTDGAMMVRECVFRKLLTKPMTVKLLDMSRNYWLNHGISDWGIVIDAETEEKCNDKN